MSKASMFGYSLASVSRTRRRSAVPVLGLALAVAIVAASVSGESWSGLLLRVEALPRVLPLGRWPRFRSDDGLIDWSRAMRPPSREIIEFIAKVRGTVRCGRLWVDGPIFHSQPEFGKWYERIARWLNKNYVKVDELVRAGPGAYKLWERAR